MENMGKRISGWTNVRGNNFMGEKMSGIIIQWVNKCPPLAKIKSEQTQGEQMSGIQFLSYNWWLQLSVQRQVGKLFKQGNDELRFGIMSFVC